MRAEWIIATMLLTALGAAAQPRGSQNSQEIRASMKNASGDQGKCTIEVVVDITAEVEIFGDRATIRTIAGQPSSFRRMECSGPMPINPAEFEFKGIDGRGNQRLMLDPRTNGGRALVRIDDPPNGREGYTFDLLWKNNVDPRDFARQRRDAELEFGPNLEFNGKGEGYFRRGDGNDRIAEIEVSIRNGDVRATFHMKSGSNLFFSGRLSHTEHNHLTARVSSNGVSGDMSIDIDRDRVRNISMSGSATGNGRNRFELRWHD
jgi:hypothetical protein